MNNKTTLGIIGVVIAGVSFFGGVKYDQSKSVVLTNVNGNGGQARMNGVGGQRGMRGAFGGATAGQIVSKDATSITVSMRDGGSKIIFVSPSTTVTKSVEGQVNDLAIGKDVVVTGTANPDGSISAQSIQLRSNIATSTTR